MHVWYWYIHCDSFAHHSSALLLLYLLTQHTQSLLRSVESSKSEAMDSSRSAQVEARLRADINSLRDQRDHATNELSTYNRRISHLEEELRTTKSKLVRANDEKRKMECDSKAAISLARSLDNNNSSDMNYYKRKVAELGDRLKVAEEKNGKLVEQVAEMRTERERFLNVRSL